MKKQQLNYEINFISPVNIFRFLVSIQTDAGRCQHQWYKTGNGAKIVELSTDITTEAQQRIGELYAVGAAIRGCSAEQRLAVRKIRAALLMQSLYDRVQTQMETLSRHSDTEKSFA